MNPATGIGGGPATGIGHAPGGTGSEQITLKNSSGTVTRSLTASGGVATLAATDALVANGAFVVLQTNAGTVSSGNAGLNSPATAVVSAGVVTAVKGAA